MLGCEKLSLRGEICLELYFKVAAVLDLEELALLTIRIRHDPGCAGVVVILVFVGEVIVLSLSALLRKRVVVFAVEPAQRERGCLGVGLARFFKNLQVNLARFPERLSSLLSALVLESLRPALS